MNIKACKNSLSGHIQVPGSKSHTIRALLLASLAEGISYIKNPLASEDCISTCKAIPLVGAELQNNLLKIKLDKTWSIKGAGKNIHLPSNIIDVGNSGSLLYFLSPIVATFEGFSIFTGDESIRKRPVTHVIDVLNQLGAIATVSIPGTATCPMIIKGPINSKTKVITDGSVSSQYISGLMMSAIRMNGTLKIELTNPKETPYLTMTQKWLEQVGVNCRISSDFKQIEVDGPVEIKAFDTTIPSDWEAVAFPLMAALITNSKITIDNIDFDGTQGDDAIVDILKSVGADITVDKEKKCLVICGGKRLTTENLPNKELHIQISNFPDAICALACIACFIEGKVIIEDAAVCRKKETDRIKVLKSELEKLGGFIEDGSDYMIIHGHSPIKADGSINPDFNMHGGQVNSYLDHRIAMSLSCLGLGLKDNEIVTVKDAECCNVSFPNFFEEMNKIGANFKSE